MYIILVHKNRNNLMKEGPKYKQLNCNLIINQSMFRYHLYMYMLHFMKTFDCTNITDLLFKEMKHYRKHNPLHPSNYHLHKQKCIIYYLKILILHNIIFNQQDRFLGVNMIYRYYFYNKNLHNKCINLKLLNNLFKFQDLIFHYI